MPSSRKRNKELDDKLFDLRLGVKHGVPAKVSNHIFYVLELLNIKHNRYEHGEQRMDNRRESKNRRKKSDRRNKVTGQNSAEQDPDSVLVMGLGHSCGDEHLWYDSKLGIYRCRNCGWGQESG